MQAVAIKKYDFIDALRGLAIAGVVLIHTTLWIKPSSKWIAEIAANGNKGVQLFFVVSAFTLFLSLQARQHTEKFLFRNFFIRRFFRIAPMFYLGIIFYTFEQGFGPRHYAPDGIQWWYLPLTAAFLHGFSPGTINAIVPGGWTIADEMVFYLMAPFLFFKLRSTGRALVFIITALIINAVCVKAAMHWLGPFYSGSHAYLLRDFVYMWIFPNIPVFGMGILLYHLFNQTKPAKGLEWVLLLLSVFLILECFGQNDMEVWKLIARHTPWYFLFSIGFVPLALSLYLRPFGFLVNGITRWLGKLSFSIYLVHFFVLDALMFLTKRPFVIKSDLCFAMAFLILLLISACLSYFTYSYIEKPGIKWGERIIDRLGGV